MDLSAKGKEYILQVDWDWMGMGVRGIRLEMGRNGGREFGERELELVDILGRCGNLVQCTLPGIYEGDFSEDSK